ncbi:MAG TPA: zinc metallopeptidase [Firmicutes bacterium]|nr:zinc metallopeptidase [Bacillota bacterium]
MFGYYYGIDMTYLVLVLPAFLFSLWAQMKVNSTFSRYSKVRSLRGLTGAQAARYILDRNGLAHVRIEQVAGNLTDHFDPRTNVVRLSQSVYNVPSIAAVGVAAHECGHAVQYAVGYGPMKLRAAIIPATNFGSKLALPLILIGLLFNSSQLLLAGILLFSLTAVFQLVTLPVEFNASSRALRTLDQQGILTQEELAGTRKVLTAAALTYVAALLVALAQLVRMLLLYNRRRD